MNQLRLFIPITKVDVEQRLVYGTLSAEVADKSGEILDYASAKPAFETWSNQISEATGGKSLGNVRAMHGSVAAGKLTDLSFDDDAKRVDGCAKIVDEAEWQKVLEGVYTGFSIGGGYARRWQDPNDPKLKRYTPILSEVSIVDNPCVPTATFEVIKADGSVEMRKFNHSSNEDSMTKATDNAAPAALTADVAKAADAVTDAKPAEGGAEGQAVEPVVKVETVSEGKAVKPKAAPVQKWEASDGKTFLSKRECEVHELELEKQAEHAPAMAKMNALLEDAAVAKDELAADSKVVEKAADAAVAKADEVKPAEATVIAKADAPKLLAKGLYQVGWLADLLSNLQSLQSSVEFEQMWEQDSDSELPAKFKGLVSETCQVLVALLDEETKELIAGDDTDIEVLAAAAKMTPAHAVALTKHVSAEALKAELEKAGARHSKSDMDQFADMHQMVQDHASALTKMARGPLRRNVEVHERRRHDH